MYVHTYRLFFMVAVKKDATTLSRMTVGMMTLDKMTLSLMTLGKMTQSLTSHNIMAFDTQHNNKHMTHSLKDTRINNTQQSSTEHLLCTLGI